MPQGLRPFLLHLLGDLASNAVDLPAAWRASVVILDEPTASLDAESEAAVFARMQQVAE